MPTKSESTVITRDPRWSGPAISPGEILLEEFLKPLGLRQADAAERLGISANRLSEVVLGKRRITPDTAQRLSRMLKTSPQFWMRLQADWELASATAEPPGPTADHATAPTASSSRRTQHDTPRVFVSYSHDSEHHKEWVRRFAEDLRASGIDAVLDQWDLALGQDIAAFMVREISSSTRVILVCTKQYVQKAERGTGGVGYERLVVTSELVQMIDTKKFLPIVRDNATPAKTPKFLGPRFFVDFSRDADYQQNLEQVVREIHGTPSNEKPPLGQNPFAAAAPTASGPKRLASTSGTTEAGLAVLDDGWFTEHLSVAHADLKAASLSGATELRYALHDPVNRSQLELLNAVQKSEIHTFGWPIGILLLNRDEFRPRPTSDGIITKVAIPEDSGLGRSSYDYWSLRNNGDFYLLQNLFEDGRSEQSIFFDTRIVRVTESLMFCANLYDNLNVSPEAPISVRVSHYGLANRTLRAASPTRHVFPAVTQENVAISDLQTSVVDLRDHLTDRVMQILEPMFMLFDFKRFDPSIYDEIVKGFVKESQ